MGADDIGVQLDGDVLSGSGALRYPVRVNGKL
jgi:hypothetical protein